MRYTNLIYPLLAATFAASIFAHESQQRPLKDIPTTSSNKIHNNLGPAMPPSDPNSNPNSQPPADSNTVILSDVLGRDRSINVFAGFTRDFAHLSRRFEDRARNTTVLAPVNSAIMGLPRKPWEGPDEGMGMGNRDGKGGEGEGMEEAQKNLRRFVEAHVVPVSPWEEGVKVATLGGRGEVWWEWGERGVKMVCFCEAFPPPRCVL